MSAAASGFPYLTPAKQTGISDTDYSNPLIKRSISNRYCLPPTTGMFDFAFETNRSNYFKNSNRKKMGRLAWPVLVK
ncbi:hypothetical protein [uncultured Alistipes sp.]|jgi:hypothetical protein|uniref:hypothetical protein n=1 Tax=uncultured Alistipes sp. TaxID=538949 RepID=UPI0025EB9709|nr:hypothetical protein [uncultured Alistipes sp.]